MTLLNLLYVGRNNNLSFFTNEDVINLFKKDLSFLELITYKYNMKVLVIKRDIFEFLPLKIKKLFNFLIINSISESVISLTYFDKISLSAIAHDTFKYNTLDNLEQSLRKEFLINKETEIQVIQNDEFITNDDVTKEMFFLKFTIRIEYYKIQFHKIYNKISTLFQINNVGKYKIEKISRRTVLIKP